MVGREKEQNLPIRMPGQPRPHQAIRGALPFYCCPYYSSYPCTLLSIRGFLFFYFLIKFFTFFSLYQSFTSLSFIFVRALFGVQINSFLYISYPFTFLSISFSTRQRSE